jgi:hypothetical protein
MCAGADTQLFTIVGEYMMITKERDKSSKLLTWVNSKIDPKNLHNQINQQHLILQFNYPTIILSSY